ncbi:hypothetical protein INT46_004760 [Mucor plumbeus]|uniref:BRCT domain-containing protein n=1 Tax=Mucor plumbeus TaxID=97098 RepID=A0A8H7VHR1_9FUNG|nr:hypothetical protein INT46_004760 [Mucor plumbeus]
MDSISCTHDSFNFKRTEKSVKKVNKVKQKAKRRVIIEEEDDALVEDIDTTDLPIVLQNCTLYIHQSANRNRLKAIAEALGAVVRSDVTTSTTHVVIEPKGDPKLLKLIKQVLSKGITCASPQWLIDCYEKKEYCSATYYPYAMDMDAHILSSNPTDITPISNPFGTSFIDYDAEESKRANRGQTNLDGFITRTGNLPEITTESTPLENTRNEDEYSAPLDTQSNSTASYAPDLLDEQEEMAREFYYNSNGEVSNSSANNSASIETQQETEEELKEKRKQAEQRLLKAQQVIQQRIAQLKKEKREPPRAKKTLQSGFGERLKIWYGEQAVHQEDTRKRRVIQSATGNQPQPQQQRLSSTATSSRRQAQQAKRPKI